MVARAFERGPAPSPYEHVVAHHAPPALAIDEQGIVRYANAAAERFFARGPLVGTELGLPVSTDGTAEVDVLRPGTWSLVAQVHAVQLAEVAGYAIYVTDVTDRRRAEEQLALLAEVGAAFERASTAAEALSGLLPRLGDAAGWSAGVVWLVDGPVLRPAATWHRDDPLGFASLHRDRTLPAGAELAGRCWERRRPVWVRDMTEGAGSARRRVMTTMGLRTATAVPALDQGEVIAVVECFGYERSPSEDRTVDAVAAVTGGLGPVIVRRRLEDERARLASELAARNATLEVLNARLEGINDRLSRSNDDLQQFASAISHDLRAPLVVMQGFLDLLLEDGLEGEARGMAEAAQRTAGRMGQIVDDLLEYSRITTAPRAPEPVDTAGLVVEIVDLLGVTGGDGPSEVTVGALPPVLGEPTLLRQLFQNLLDNARKFVAPGQVPAVHVAGAVEGELVRFTVRDNGIGIPPEARERVLHPFKRAVRTDDYPGTGIGLAICARVVDRHGGTLEIGDAEPSGTAVTFTLPAVR
jgi:signal transduction histidine kinase